MRFVTAFMFSMSFLPVFPRNILSNFHVTLVTLRQFSCPEKGTLSVMDHHKGYSGYPNFLDRMTQLTSIDSPRGVNQSEESERFNFA
mgnify:CR=1 FL=1